jgi:SAM-dependent methyltransferase
MTENRSHPSDNIEFYSAFARVYTAAYRDVDADEMVRQWAQLLDRLEGMKESLKKVGQGADVRVPRLLDVACGPGWHLPAWSAFGFEVWGLDANPAMLRFAADTLSQHKMASSCLVQADIREVPIAHPELHCKFDLVTAHFNFPHLFAPPEFASALAGAAVCLRAGGYFLFDCTPLPSTPPESVDEVVDAGGMQIRLAGHFNDSLCCYIQRWSGHELETVEHYWFHRANEMREAITGAGMNLECVLGWHPDNHAAPWGACSDANQRAMYICRRL